MKEPANINASTPVGMRFRDWPVNRKIAVGFGGLILLMAVGMGITLFKLDNVKRIASTALEQRQPVANFFLRLSQDLNHAIALMDTYLLTGETRHKTEFDTLTNGIIHRLLGAGQQDLFLGLGLDGALREARAQMEAFRSHAAELFRLYDEGSNNLGLILAQETVNPQAIRFLNNINMLLDGDNIDPSDPSIAPVLPILHELRYNWVRMMWLLNLYVTNQSEANLTDFNNFSDRVDLLMGKLNRMNIEIGFGEFEEMSDAHVQYLRQVPAVLNIFQSGHWRADTRLIKTQVQPITEHLQALFENTADMLLDDAFDSSEQLSQSLQHIRLSAFVILALAVLLGALLAVIISRGIAPSIRRLMTAAGQVASGDLNAEVMVTTRDEIGQLGTSFNIMVDHLRAAALKEQQMLDELETRVQDRTRELELSETKIRAILDNIAEGILVLNEDDRIESMNPAAEKIFAMKEPDSIGVDSRLLIDQKSTAEPTRFVDTEGQLVECRGMRSDGSTFPMEFVVSRMNLDARRLRVCVVRDITTRKNTEHELATAQSRLVDAAHKSGMAEMATGVLHNIGNILNSVNLAGEEIARIANNSRIASLTRANDLLREHQDDMSEFLLNDPRGRKLPEFYLKIGQVLDDEVATVRREADSLIEKTTMMKEVISTQQSYARSGFHSETLNIGDLVEDALKIQASSLHKWGVKLNKQLADTPACTGQKSKLLQVITNLIKNAQEAMRDNDNFNKPKELTIETGQLNQHRVFVRVRDNGCGIASDQLSKIFSHGFTTKEDGHGFGLHTSANAMTEMHGSLSVESEGRNKGATFTLTVPIDKAA